MKRTLPVSTFSISTDLVNCNLGWVTLGMCQGKFGFIVKDKIKLCGR